MASKTLYAHHLLWARADVAVFGDYANTEIYVPAQSTLICFRFYFRTLAHGCSKHSSLCGTSLKAVRPVGERPCFLGCGSIWEKKHNRPADLHKFVLVDTLVALPVTFMLPI